MSRIDSGKRAVQVNTGDSTESDDGAIVKDASENVAVAEKAAESISLTIAGDAMFDRAVDYHFRDDKLFDVVSSIKDVFGKTNVSFINLEGPISSIPIPADGTRDSMIFNFPPKTTEVLADLGISGVSLANNHTNNNGKAGLANTKKVLGDKHILAVGEEATFGDYSVGRFVNGNARLSIVTINCLEVNQNLNEIISQEKSTGAKVLVFPHWGEEYKTVHNNSQERLAHSWIDAGADMVVGGHPHVVQDGEEYKGRPIFYSLGNFIFDQTWSKETQQGLILKVNFEDKKLEVEVLPIESIKYMPELKIGENRDVVLKRFFEEFGQNNIDGILKFNLNNED
jgi:poly-gamma-glutamate synthesis protein (capsule biosynthesis protein)